jgi:DNA-binding transcriptional regulator YbjK
VAIPPPRKRDGEERRRELCDAAIRVLAEQGSRGLTHQRVDRAANVPDGTTSYYYRTREALLRGVGQRVADIDLANIASVTAESTRTESPFGRLAQLVVDQSEGPGLLLNKARLELMLAAVRDPELADKATALAARGVALTHEAIDAVAPRSDDPELRETQSTAVMTFISGIFTQFAAGDRTLADAERLERLFHAIVTAVALEHGA